MSDSVSDWKNGGGHGDGACGRCYEVSTVRSALAMIRAAQHALWALVTHSRECRICSYHDITRRSACHSCRHVSLLPHTTVLPVHTCLSPAVRSPATTRCSQTTMASDWTVRMCATTPTPPWWCRSPTCAPATTPKTPTPTSAGACGCSARRTLMPECSASRCCGLVLAAACPWLCRAFTAYAAALSQVLWRHVAPGPVALDL